MGTAPWGVPGVGKVDQFDHKRRTYFVLIFVITVLVLVLVLVLILIDIFFGRQTFLDTIIPGPRFASLTIATIQPPNSHTLSRSLPISLIYD